MFRNKQHHRHAAQFKRAHPPISLRSLLRFPRPPTQSQHCHLHHSTACSSPFSKLSPLASLPMRSALFRLITIAPKTRRCTHAHKQAARASAPSSLYRTQSAAVLGSLSILVLPTLPQMPDWKPIDCFCAHLFIQLCVAWLSAFEDARTRVCARPHTHTHTHVCFSCGGILCAPLAHLDRCSSAVSSFNFSTFESCNCVLVLMHSGMLTGKSQLRGRLTAVHREMPY